MDDYNKLSRKEIIDYLFVKTGFKFSNCRKLDLQKIMVLVKGKEGCGY
jgi:hypothetical protein